MILRGGGFTLFPYYDLGGLWKISNENDTEHFAVGRSYNSCLLFHFDKMLILNNLLNHSFFFT